MFLLLFNLFNRTQTREPEKKFSEFVEAVEKGDVSEIVIQGRVIHGTLRSKEIVKTFGPDDPDLMRMLREKKVEISVRPEEGDPWYIAILVQWFPMLLLIG